MLCSWCTSLSCVARAQLAESAAMWQHMAGLVDCSSACSYAAACDQEPCDLVPCGCLAGCALCGGIDGTSLRTQRNLPTLSVAERQGLQSVRDKVS